MKETHLITGGGGYVGYHLGKSLCQIGHQVVLFDIHNPVYPMEEQMSFIKGDIREYDDVKKACIGVDCVYHVASYGMSGKEQLNKNLIEEVNVGGTKNVLKVCRNFGIERLVYTSTYNVVFGGQVIENGDETLPYLPLDKHPDNYSRTKSIAEKLVLEANDQESADSRLLTCALRLAGVYGPGEQRHLPRIVGMIEKGLFCFTYGAPDSLVEFLHIDNLVQSHIKAAEALTSSKNYVAAGQPYFISDCKPVQNFEFFRPLVEGLGYKFPTLRLPITLIYFLAFVTEIIHSIVGRVYNFQPMLTRTEVYKTGVTHWFDIKKAQLELGYSPTVQNDMSTAVKWFIDRGYGCHRYKKENKWTQNAFNILLAFLFIVSIMSFLPVIS